ncbi:MAG: hypothetical protein ACPW60_03625 [Methylohalobius sp. ZOD2]|nr:hypothetical protein [Methylothermaceae bacterium]
MKSKLLKALAAGALVTMGGVASAQPVALNDAQMDTVSAGGDVFANAFAEAFGLFQAGTFTNTNTHVELLQISNFENTAISVTYGHSDSYSEGFADGIAVVAEPDAGA